MVIILDKFTSVHRVRLLSATRQKRRRIKEEEEEKEEKTMTFNSKQQQSSSSSSSSSLVPGNRGIIHSLVFCFLQARRRSWQT
jgi:hypothetical protein